MGRSPKPVPALINPLDELLPRISTDRAEVHPDVTLLEVDHPAQLLELAADPKIRRYLLGRLSDTVALVEAGQHDAIGKALLAGGRTPKSVTGVGT